MTRAILCVAIVMIASFLFTSGKQVKQTKKQRVIPDQFEIVIGDVPRWLYRHAYNVSINGQLKTDKERVPSLLRFNRTMLPADLYEQVYLNTFILPPEFKPRPDKIDPRKLTFDEMRKIEAEEVFGTERPYAWLDRGWNYTCEVCRMEFAYAGDYHLHVYQHYVTNYSATPIMNWTIIQMQNDAYRNESERAAIDYWNKVAAGEIEPDYDTPATVPTVTYMLDEPIICHVCNASIYNTSEYNPHMLAHVEWENEKLGNLTIKMSRPTKSFDDIHFRKMYVQDSLNTQEEEEYEEAQRIIKEASHSLNTDEIMERTQNMSINKRLLEFAVDSRGFTITWPRVKLAPRMEPLNDSQGVRGDEPIFEDPDINRYHDEKRKRWEEDYLRRRKAQEKGNPDFATYSVESNETAAERRALNITRRKRKYTPKLIYIRRKRDVREENVRREKRSVEEETTQTRRKKITKPTAPYNILLGKKKLRRVNSNKRKKLDVVYKQQLNKIIQKAKEYMKKFNKTHYPTTQSVYEKVHIYKLKEKFKKLNWYLWGLDNYTAPSDVDIDTFTNTPLTTVRPLIYKRIEKRDLLNARLRDYNQHKRRIDELKALVDGAERMNAEIQAENDGTGIRKKRDVNFEDINLQEIENALKPLSVEKGIETKDEMEILAYQKNLMELQRKNYKKLLFKRDVNSKVNNADKNQRETFEFDHSAEHYNKNQSDSIEFDDSAPYRQGTRIKRDVQQDTKNNQNKDVNHIEQTFDSANVNRTRDNKQVTSSIEQLMQCEFYKNLLDEKKAIDTEERQMVRKTNEAIKADRENANKTTEAIVEKESGGEGIEVRHFEGGREIRDDALTEKLKNSIRNKRHAQVHDHAKCEENLQKKEMCEEFQPRRVRREPRFRKDRIPTKKKKRSTCPFFKRSQEFWNCTDCSKVYSLEGELAEHQWKKHNGSACIVSYDTKDIEDEYHSWNYDQIWRNDTVETTHEKWVKRCKVPNQKRHRFMNRGCTQSYREGMLGGVAGGEENRKKRSVRQRRSLVRPPSSVDNAPEDNPGQSLAETQKRRVRDVRKGRVHKVQRRSLELIDSEGNKLSPSNLPPSLEAKYGPIFKGKYDHLHDGKSIELRRTEEMSEFSGPKNVTIHRLNDTLLRYIETLDTNETLAQALENRDRQGRMRREVVCEDLTDELNSNVRDESKKYHWTNTKSWEWRIKNVNIREYMYRIMEERMRTTPEKDPDAVFYDMYDASHEQIKYPSHESRNRRVSQFYADNGYFSGRTGSDLEIYQDSNPNLFDMREIGAPVTPEHYLFNPRPELFSHRHRRYTNVKPGNRTRLPPGHTTEHYPNPMEFTDKKDYYDSDIEVAKSQFRFRRDLNRGQYSMVASHKLNPPGKSRSKRSAGPNNIEYDTDYSSNLQQFEAIDTHPELFKKIYPGVSVYTPYTLYPTTLHGLSEHPDPNATYPWIEKSGPDSDDDLNLRKLDALEQSVKDELEYELASNAMKENTHVNSEEYRDWLEWQRNRSLEDENSYSKIMWTCKFHPCTFNASIEDQVGDHIFVDHFTYPKNYKEAVTYALETTRLGWERLTDVNYLLHRYSDENLHPDIKEDFDIFTGIWDDLSFPTVHPNFTLPSKPKRTRFVPTEHPDMETVPSTKAKKRHSIGHHPHGHPITGHHPHAHPTTSHRPTVDHIARDHHHRQKRGYNDYNLSNLPTPPPDSSNKGSGPNHEDRPRRRYF